jgi:hypothetical protein
MAHGELTEIIPAPSQAVFDLIHDYSRRLEWDTLLQAAYLADGYTSAGKGVTSVCVGRSSLGGIALKTVYVTFDRPTLAAVLRRGSCRMRRSATPCKGPLRANRFPDSRSPFAA